MFKPIFKAVLFFALIVLISACGPTEDTVPPSATPAAPVSTTLPATSTVTPTFPPTTSIPLDGRGGGVIAFYSERDGNAEIYIMNADESAETRLTQNRFRDVTPDISPDGSQIVFVSNRDGNDEIYRMDRDGGGVTWLTDEPAQDSYPFWSPDGTKIIFCSKRDDRLAYEIYVMNSDGSEQSRITHTTVSEEWAYLSLDMQQIAYAIGPFPEYKLHVMNADGREPHLLLETDQNAAIPKWSRDGKMIAYNLFVLTGGNIIGDVFLVEADGSNSRQITETGGVYVSENPYWSPDGRRIVFQSNRTGNFQIYVMNADGSDQIRLTNHDGNDYWPSWGGADRGGSR